MDGKADGSYLIGRETKAKLAPLSTPPANGPAIPIIKVPPFFNPFKIFNQLGLKNQLESLSFSS